ncbi:MAG: 1-acyl-sn-glycerol-3-phosphate acyltransferase [Chitinophagaceae bacterium]|nr:1-acyl-sn-glycerol-3-phosphate acyltransferase [Chitinophagaceae bacterium]
MKFLLRPLHWFYSVYAFITFVAVMLLVFPFAIIGSMFGKIKGGNFIFMLCRLWADIWFFLIFIRHKKIFEAPHDKSKPFIFVSNHISYLDAAIIPKAYRQPIRPLGKVEMSKVPVFGFIYRNAIVTVDRSSTMNRANSIRVLKSIIKKGISVMVFPEGTFNMTTKPLKDFYDGAFRVAIETQTPLKPVLFLDAYRRMPYESLFSMSPGLNRIVYLDAIGLENLTLADLEKFKLQVFNLMEKKLIEYNAAWRNAK